MDTFEKVALFIDAENLVYAAQNLYQHQVDFRLVLKIASRYGSVVQANAYADFTRLPHEATLKLFVSGIRLIHAPEWTNAGQGSKNSTDPVLSTDLRDLLEQDSSISTYVLASGDGHFVPLIASIHRRGKEAGVIAMPKSVSSVLIRSSDFFIPYPLEHTGDQGGHCDKISEKSSRGISSVPPEASPLSLACP